MENRIKELRKSLCLTQQEFADRLGLNRAAISNYEIGRNEPIPAVISLICRDFRVSEEWLRHGTGEMFVKLDMEDELSELFGLTLADDSPLARCKRTVVHSMLQAGPEFWDVFLDIAEKLAQQKEEQDP